VIEASKRAENAGRIDRKQDQLPRLNRGKRGLTIYLIWNRSGTRMLGPARIGH
jgi:hypothetical protein